MRNITKAAAAALVLLTIPLAILLSDCNNEASKPAVTGLPEYRFENIEYPVYKNEERRLEADENITVDGRLDEKEWEGQNYLNLNGNGYTCSVTTVFGTKGVYFGIRTNDPQLHVNPERPDWQNTGIELHIAKTGTENREDAVMLRITAGDVTVGGMRGSYEGSNINGYVWDWVPFYVRSFVDGELTDGILSSDQCKGASWEILLPWEALAMDGPGNIVCLPAYNHSPAYDEFSGNLREHIQYYGNMFLVETWPMFTSKGSVIEPDDENDTIGDALIGGQKTAGWDLTKRDDGRIVSNGGNVQEIWFREADSQWYMVEATMSEARPNNDIWPSGGVIICDDHAGGGMRLQMFIGYDGEGTHSFKIYNLLRQEPAFFNGELPGDTGAKTAAGVKLKVIRHDKDYWIYINDRLIYKGASEELSSAGIAGLYTVGMDAVFTDYKYTPEPELPDESEEPMFRPDVESDTIGDAIDGNFAKKTAGWDLQDRDNGVISTATGGVQEIWFKERAAEWYMVETTVSRAAAVNDEWPSGGIVLSDDGMGHGIRIQYFIGYNGEGSQWIKIYDIDRKEPCIREVQIGYDSGIKSESGAKLKVIRHENEFWIYVNDRVVYYGLSEELSGAGVAGLYTVGMEATFKDYKYTLEPALPDISEYEHFLPEKDDEAIGDSIDETIPAKKSTGWDLKDRGSGVVSTIAGGLQTIWFRKQAADWYMIETTISDAEPCDDVWPSGGVILSDDGMGHGIWLQFFIGYNGEGNQWFKIYNAGREEPCIREIQLFGDTGMKSEDGAKLKVIRHEKEFWIYVNGKLAYYGTSDELDSPGIAGLYTVGMKATFKEYKYTEKPELPSEHEEPKNDGVKIVRGSWDTSRIEEKILVSGAGHCEVWFDVPAADKYTVSVRVSGAAAMNDNWPSAGLLVGDDLNGKGIRLSQFIGWKGAADSHWIKCYNLQFSEPSIKVVYLNGRSGIETEEGAVLRIVRNGSKFRYFVNDRLIYEGESELLTALGFTGFYTIGCRAVFSEYEYSDEAEWPDMHEEPDPSELKIVRGSWDTSRIEEKVLVSGGGHCEVWFDVPAADKYTVSVKVSGAAALNDNWPSVGLLVGDDLNSRGIRISQFIGWQGSADNHWIKCYNLQFSEPSIKELSQNGRSGVESAEGAVLKIVRDGKSFSYYINDQLVYEGESELLANAGYAGFYSFGCRAEFSDYSYSIID